MGEDSEESEPPNSNLEARVLVDLLREIPPFKDPEKPKGEHEIYCTCESCLRRREGIESDKTYDSLLERKELKPEEEKTYPLNGYTKISPIFYHPSRRLNFGYLKIPEDKSSTNPESDTAKIGYKKHLFLYF